MEQNLEMISGHILTNEYIYILLYSNINNSRRLNTYCIFKHTFNLEPHLDNITNKLFRIAVDSDYHPIN